LAQRKTSDPQVAKFLHKAGEQVSKLNRLVSDLLDVTRVEHARLPFHKETFDCRNLILEVVDTFQQTYPAWNIHYSGTEHPAPVYADKQRIEQVLINLIDNAIKYSPQSKKVFVGMQVAGDSIRISVRDEGIGMTEEQQKGLFKRFYRVEDNLTKIPGLGLGLYLSEQIISAHGGELACKSEEGKGSELYFLLPVATHQIPTHSKDIYEKAGSDIRG